MRSLVETTHNKRLHSWFETCVHLEKFLTNNCHREGCAASECGEDSLLEPAEAHVAAEAKAHWISLDFSWAG